MSLNLVAIRTTKTCDAERDARRGRPKRDRPCSISARKKPQGCLDNVQKER